jgi:nitrogen PTS system EIIA component
MDLTRILAAKSVRFATGVSSKKRLLQDIADQAEMIYGLKSETVFSCLQERENMGTTGVGRGIGIPHARLESLDSVVGLFTRLEKPINYNAMDRQPVDLVFTLLAPVNEGAEHLKALAMVSRTLRNENICAKLRANDDSHTLFSILTEKVNSEAA